jgi:hypothetical protein
MKLTVAPLTPRERIQVRTPQARSCALSPMNLQNGDCPLFCRWLSPFRRFMGSPDLQNRTRIGTMNRTPLTQPLPQGERRPHLSGDARLGHFLSPVAGERTKVRGGGGSGRGGICGCGVGGASGRRLRLQHSSPFARFAAQRNTVSVPLVTPSCFTTLRRRNNSPESFIVPSNNSR